MFNAYSFQILHVRHKNIFMTEDILKSFTCQNNDIIPFYYSKDTLEAICKNFAPQIEHFTRLVESRQ